MAKIKLDNVSFIMAEDFTKPFSVSGYTFYPQDIQKQPKLGNVVYTNKQAIRDNRRHQQNAYVKYKRKQMDSIIFGGGRVGANKYHSRKRKFLEDLLLIGSLLTAQNWQLFSRRNLAQYSLVSRNNLELISENSKECQQHMEIAVAKLKDASWRKQFDNGFHLRMLLNHANIFITESRFLNMVVIWEWLYPHLKNPDGATPNDESNNLREIFSFTLEKYWPQHFNSSLRQSNIFYVLRNQLAHSGKIPIDRSYAEHWMTQIPWEKGIEKYLGFFDHLTQIVVLKTLDIDGENSLKVFNFPEKLQLFLQTGKI